MSYRVIQWATGSIGSEALKQIIDRPHLQLAGVFVYSNKKHGRDAGELCGRANTGIVASCDRAEILALDADAVIHSPSLDPTADVDADIEALLRSGKNVITHRGYIWPPAGAPERATRLEAACRAGRATLFGTGINPGFFNDRIGPALTGACTNLRSIEFGVAADLAGRSALALQTCAIGINIADVNLDFQVVKTMDDVYREGIHLTALQLGAKVFNIRQEVELAPATRDLVVGGVPIAKGSVGAVKWRWIASLEGGITLRYEFRFFVDKDIPGWDLRHVRSMRIDADPPLYVEYDLAERAPADAGEPYLPLSRSMASLAINAIPEVVAAAPGFLRPSVFAPWQLLTGA